MSFPLPESREDICFVSVRLVYPLAHFPLTFSLSFCLFHPVCSCPFLSSCFGHCLVREWISACDDRIYNIYKGLGYFLLASFGYLYFFFWGSYTLLLWMWTHQIFVIRYAIYSFFHYLDLFFIVISSFD
jgi:hypothetical protein